MRLDLISIFPEYFDALNLSLIGRAQQDHRITIERTDLRDFTDDRHRTVDSPPVGGGAGMVMKPEPWARALTAALEREGAAARPTLIIPTPSGEVFTQAIAEELAAQPHLIFAPGRFEGIDERLTEWAQDQFEVRRLSIGDYVLNGGEAATLVMVEAITRLLPDVVGNAASLEEESHADGLLEYPVYTKPAQWRGLEVPEVLLSGHHARIVQWRREQQLQRTREIRPDMWERYALENPPSVQ